MALLPLGIFSAAGAGGAAPAGFELIETYVLGSSQASVTFSNLGTHSSTYRHLQIRALTSDTFTGGNGSSIIMRFNGDSGSNYAWHSLNGNGSSVTSTAAASQNRITLEQGANSFFAGNVIDILDAYATKNKTVRGLTGRVASGTNLVRLFSGLWNNTASLTSVSFTTEGFNFAAGCRFSLYGIKG